MERPLTAADFEGWRFICRTHEWMSNRVPCPDGDGEDTRPHVVTTPNGLARSITPWSA